MIVKVDFRGPHASILATIRNLRAQDIPFCTSGGFNGHGEYIGKGSRYLAEAWGNQISPTPKGWSDPMLRVTIRERDIELVLLASCAKSTEVLQLWQAL